MNDIVPVTRRTLVLAATAFVALPFAAHAQDASPWTRDSHAQIRLLAGSRNGPVLLGGISFKLDKGWKTYWRTPGDSGVPPRFDFSKSENVEAVTVLWPAPQAFPDGAGGTALGYHNDVVIPLRIAVHDQNKPVTLNANIQYAVCEKLCVPAQADLSLAFTSVASTEDSTLSAALDRVPKPANVGDPNPLTIRDVKRVGPKAVQVDVVVPDKTEPKLFVEGPSPDWALPVPKLAAHHPPGVKRFVFDLVGLPTGVNPEGAALKFTLTGGERAYEFNVNLY
jgi:DsbC/DsbD-like thiol-disulfide interchange protein